MRRWKRLLVKAYNRRFVYPFEGTFQTHYVNKIGIARTCNVGPKIMMPDTRQIEAADYAKIVDFDLVYVGTRALPVWLDTVYPRLRDAGTKIILVTGHAVASAPHAILESVPAYDFKELQKHGVIAHWFVQNCDAPDHPFLTQIPIGIDFHMLHREARWGEPKTDYHAQDHALQDLSKGLRNRENWLKRSPEMLVDIHHMLQSNVGDRQAAYDASQRLAATALVPKSTSRSGYWINVTKARFVLLPHGVGLDCHRTWEAIILGAVPIVPKSTISHLFNGLPVIELDSYDDLTDDLLAAYEYPDMIRPDAEQRLKTAYWCDLLLNKQRELRGS